jgi:hypothetical protein
MDVAHHRPVLQRLGHGAGRIGLEVGQHRRHHDLEGRIGCHVELDPERRQRPLVLQPRSVQAGPGAKQRQFALEEIVLTNRADLEPPGIERVERVVDRGVGTRGFQRHARCVHVEEEPGGFDRDVLARLEVLLVRQFSPHRLFLAVPRHGVRPQDRLPEADGDRSGRPGHHVLRSAHGHAGK